MIVPKPEKLIALDLDQTLLRSDLSISDYTVQILEKCRLHGMLVAFATARSEYDCTPFTAIIKPDAIVSNRGANVRVGDSIIGRTVMDIETTDKLISTCLSTPNTGHIYVFTDKGYFTNIPESQHDPAWGKYRPEMYTDFSQSLGMDSYKTTVQIFDYETACAIAEKFPELDMVRFSGDPWYSFANSKVNKWEGVKSVASHFGIENENIIAFGDDYSDVILLRECGVGVAVENAIAEVKAVADHICESNDNDGVARWLDLNFSL